MENLLMTVIGNENNLTCIDIKDVDFIETDNRRIIYNIGNVKYYQITHKSELDDLLTKHNFISLDRTNIVNLSKISKFDKEYGKVYFTTNPDKDSTFATVAKIKYKHVAKIIDFVSSNNSNNTLHSTTNELLSRGEKKEKMKSWLNNSCSIY